MGQTRLRTIIDRATAPEPAADDPRRERTVRTRNAARERLARLVLRLLKQIDRPWRKQRWGPKTISDLTSDVSRKFFERLAMFRGKSVRELRAWLKTSLSNNVKNAIREADSRKPRDGKVVQLSGARGGDSGRGGPSRSDCEQRERRFDVRELVGGLSALDRRLIRLRYHDDKPIAEVAAELGLSERTVHRRINAVLAQLAERLEE